MEQITKGLLSWASILEEQARAQAIATSTLPFISPHVALMPDAHWGMGSTVGSVIPTVGCVMPAAVGVDIGCGMAAVRTQLTASDVEARGDLVQLRVAIQDRVPVSPGVYRPELTDTARDRVTALEEMAAKQGVNPDQYSGKSKAADWRLQLGTLGGGNHFIELCFDEEDRVWVFLHSGSRGVGNRIAKHHVAVAQKLCERWHVQLPHRDLAFLPQEDDAFWPYIRDLRWAQAFALENRSEMLDQVVAALAAWIGGPIADEEKILCHHNYTERYCLRCNCSPDSDSRPTEHPSAGRSASTTPGSPDGCHPSGRSCGGPPRLGAEDAPASSASRGGAPGRTGFHQDAPPPAHGSSRTRERSSGSDEPAFRSGTDAPSRTSSSRSGRGSDRHAEAGTDARTRGRAPAGSAYGALAQPDCTHLGTDSVVWLTRKGAINAEQGRWGLIPGSMGTRSYVVTGKGNRASFNSAPHGAGRNFSRTEARKRFTAADLAEAMKGIEWRSDNAEAFIDEIPGAYKSIDQVMLDAADLVTVRHELRQFLNVKGE